MNIQSNVLSIQRPDVPATFESLNDDTLTTTLQFVGDKSYKSFGGINKRCRKVYLNTEGMTKKTFLYGYAPLSVIIDKCENGLWKSLGWRNQSHFTPFERVGKGVVFHNRRDVMDWALKQTKSKVLEGICRIAAKEGRIDLLNEVWNHDVNEHKIYKRAIFEEVDRDAASGGKLNVLKWFETKELSICKYLCGEVAAFYGHIHVLQWLIEEKGLELNGGYYTYAAQGNQLHVMKWLREQEVDWDMWLFIMQHMEKTWTFFSGFTMKAVLGIAVFV